MEYLGAADDRPRSWISRLPTFTSASKSIVFYTRERTHLVAECICHVDADYIVFYPLIVLTA